MSQLRVAVVFHRFGPYHRARLTAAASAVEVFAVELSSRTDVYAWDPVRLPKGIHHKCLSDESDSRSLRGGDLYRLVESGIGAFAPDVVAVNGYADNGALAVLSWCLRNNVPAILMSESNRFDEPRSPVREWVKRRIVQCFSSALVGGASAKEYAVELGLPLERVFLGYDVIDNDHFDRGMKGQSAASATSPSCERPYFLASNRFVEKKNLPRLIQAYSQYREECARGGAGGADAWDLVMLGDGPMREELLALTSRLKLMHNVHFVGFKQYDQLPGFYWNAGAFIHASTTEQWGLVVNEAMASGLPVLVSNRCGCAANLVHEGVNGFTFDPTDIGQISRLMCRVADVEFPRSEFGRASQEIVADWGPERFASGLLSAAEKAIEVGPKRAGAVDRLLLELLCRR